VPRHSISILQLSTVADAHRRVVKFFALKQTDTFHDKRIFSNGDSVLGYIVQIVINLELKTAVTLGSNSG
jgi:hypothetical protein